MEKTETQTKKQIDKEFRETFGGVGAMIPVQVNLFEPYVRFAKEYLAFFGSKEKLDIFFMRLIYNSLEHLHSDLSKFVGEKEHFVHLGEWYKKHSHVAAMSDQPEDEDSEAAKGE